MEDWMEFKFCQWNSRRLKFVGKKVLLGQLHAIAFLKVGMKTFDCIESAYINALCRTFRGF